jgi:hypothetical protein
VSPTLYKLSNAFKNFTVEGFSEIIGQLLGCGNLENFDIAVADMMPEEVPLDEKVLGSIRDALLSCKKQSTIVVFKDATTDCGCDVLRKIQCSNNFSEKVTNWEQSAHAEAESRVFGFQSRQ